MKQEVEVISGIYVPGEEKNNKENTSRLPS